VTQWRPDCDSNPIGPNEHGTWDEHRNGWCPGSVEPGVFIDATDFLKSASKHSLELDVTVWSNLTHQYGPYTDYGGYVNNDKAVFAVASNIFIYGKDAVAAARKKSKSFTKAEAALRHGCSDPEALKPPAVPRDFTVALLTASSAKPLARSESPPRNYNFEARSPWYFYNESKEGRPGASNHGVLVPLFQGRLMQSNTRTLEMAVNKEVMTAQNLAGPTCSWQQVALRLRLGKPNGKETDHWDRRGSVGMMIPGNIAGVQVMEEPPSPETFRTWKVQASEM